MLKGIRKNMIYVPLPKGKCFESAYFVVRSGVRDKDARQGEMVREANRIIGELELNPARKKRDQRGAKDRILFFLYGFLGGCFSVALVWLVTVIVL